MRAAAPATDVAQESTDPEAKASAGHPTKLTDSAVAREWRAIGVDVRVVVTDGRLLDQACAIAIAEIADLDLACSRFRDDSEIMALNASGAQPVVVSPRLGDAISVALQAACDTEGAVDPALGINMLEVGYDRTFSSLPADGPPIKISMGTRPTWANVEFDPESLVVRLPKNVALDLGATAKAFGSDRIAARINSEFGCGVLVSLGGDICVAGPIESPGWLIHVSEKGDPAGEAGSPATSVHLRVGGIATSTTTARRWRRGGKWMHHLIDPATGSSVVSQWRTVTVAGPTCVAANTASTAAIIMNDRAIRWLKVRGLPARLVDQDGCVTLIGGWPPDTDPRASESRESDAAASQQKTDESTGSSWEVTI